MPLADSGKRCLLMAAGRASPGPPNTAGVLDPVTRLRFEVDGEIRHRRRRRSTLRLAEDGKQCLRWRLGRYHLATEYGGRVEHQCSR